MKKSFTLFELVFVIFIISILGYYTLQMKQTNDFYESVNKFLNDVNNILNNAVMDTTTGYINGTDGNCSDSVGSYADLTSARAIECAGWGKAYPYIGNINTTDATQSYITLLKEYTNGQGCKIYLDDDSSDTTKFYIFIDCSNLNYANQDRYKAFIEEKLVHNFLENYSTIYQTIERESTAIDNSTGGSKTDGKLRILMKK